MSSKSQPPNTAHVQYNARHDGASLQNPTNHSFPPQACINEEDAWGQFVDFDDDEERESDRRAKFVSIRSLTTWVIDCKLNIFKIA